jgi:hypothetical protein
MSTSPGPDYAAILASQVEEAAAGCPGEAETWIETTYREIVDVVVDTGDDVLRRCLEDAIWEIRLDEAFENEERYELATSVR